MDTSIIFEKQADEKNFCQRNNIFEIRFRTLFFQIRFQVLFNGQVRQKSFLHKKGGLWHNFEIFLRSFI